MSKHDRLFIASVIFSMALTVSIMVDNIISEPTSSPTTGAPPSRVSAARQKILDMKLPLHEGKYWKKSHE